MVTAPEAYYEVVRRVLEDNIRTGALPGGTRLYVAALADRLGVSRSPVKRALELLEEDGLLRRNEAQGWLVGDEPASDVRPNLHLFELELPDSGSATPVKPGWERILQTVADEVVDCIPFGIWKISETELCSHFGVSRTVTREVLTRLHERGLVTKNRASHWIAGPLSAQMLGELHDMRRLLEPLALRRAAPHLGRMTLIEMRERVEAALAAPHQPAIEDFDRIEDDLHRTCVAPQPNQRLAAALPELRLSLVVNRQFSLHVARHHESALLLEHRLVLDHLIAGDAEGAATALRFHLDADHDRARARLKVLSVFGEPDAKVVPYLMRIV
ncbi:GntR family transcriptional regulator [Paenirhodobacter populi]|uniref:GntR family transcriptional regulator n=1 Tax=Paenirhodobacter populi TaxID=2306993 RepID=A0A443JC37_9RHOB|nr:GntR family transcriptional regulator [Sinirhodobacter populi]RWR18119.1 GntR family transcriptional regulator [Sinirhodobacter populi]RWR28386.1 GntR family transcriptional regulator [Sinirhodobacter populi]